MPNKYKEGDWVRVLPISEIKAKFVKSYDMPSGIHFNPAMIQYCEKEFTVEYVSKDASARRKVGVYRLRSEERDTEGVASWFFTDEMLEGIEEMSRLGEIEFSFDDLMNW